MQIDGSTALGNTMRLPHPRTINSVLYSNATRERTKGLLPSCPNAYSNASRVSQIADHPVSRILQFNKPADTGTLIYILSLPRPFDTYLV